MTTPFTFIATTEAIVLVGARPVFVDIDPWSYNLDPGKLEAAITERTRAIIPVHLYGQPCEMTAILEVARRRGLHVVEDCAQAIGARYQGRPVGTLGDVGCLSFFPSKNLGCFGDGGMVLTSDPGLAERIGRLRHHGSTKKYHHGEVGLNSRLDELQAAILRVKLGHLDPWIAARQRRAALYRELLADHADLILPPEIDGSACVYHQFTIRLPRRDEIRVRLAEAGIATAVYYPLPLHLQEVHAEMGHRRGDFPAAEQAAETCLSLPIWPELPEETLRTVARALEKAVASSGS